VRGDFGIGEWLIHPAVNSMERDGETVHLEPKVMQVLVALASEPGEVVTREQLRGVVWPDVFVGEDVLIRAISELRRAFSDDPRLPRTIETVPKVGYRLIAPISQPPTASAPVSSSLNGQSARAPEPAVPDAHETPVSESVQELAPPARTIGAPRKRIVFWIAFSLLTIAGAVWAYKALLSVPGNHRALRKEAYTSRPLTTYPGSQLQPSFSPDGGAVAFVWHKDGELAGHIYVKQLGSEAPARLTNGSAEELSPAWSPDGRWIAFIRHTEVRTSILIIPAIGGSEQEVYTLPTNHVWEYGGLTWTADGESLIFPEQADPQAPSLLVELTLDGRTIRELTHPPRGWDGDWTPAISPDGTTVAFIRGPEGSVHDIYMMKLPDGTPKRITFDGRLVVGLAWSSDGSEVVFSSNRSGSISLWRVSAQGETPEHEPAGGDNAYWPSIARQGNRLVYSHGSATWSILAVELNGHGPETEAEILTSSEQDASPHVSPAGDKIAFQSWRSGSQEIWTAKIDGSDPVQLTSAGAMAGSPSWSRDGRSIAFDARLDTNAHIYVIDANGGAPRAVTHGDFNDIVPCWSSDDRWIYFGSNRSGSWQVWKVPSDGAGPAQQVTAEGGMVAMESGDGRWLYFTHYGEPGIWRRPVAGGPVRKIFDGPPTGNLNYWTLNGDSVYSLADQGGHFTLQRIDPDTGHTQVVYALKHDPTPFAGISLSPDGKRITFAELARASSGLTLVEHFE
jgi:Tol biopolymer transport system component/DNA-binding winged helix-turn-helix (wHTH) protein